MFFILCSMRRVISILGRFLPNSFRDTSGGSKMRIVSRSVVFLLDLYFVCRFLAVIHRASLTPSMLATCGSGRLPVAGLDQAMTVS